jgi:metal-responsive CopG/Arc/MetJ family transcriptional regulator
MARVETQRIDIRVPTALLDEIDKYQEEQGIATRTAALLELARVGLKDHKKNKANKKKEVLLND